MLVIGAGGIAIQMFDDLIATKNKDIVFWSETETKFDCLKENFRILKSEEEAADYFKNESKQFVVGLWDVKARKSFTERFTNLGGELSTYISPLTHLSTHTTVGTGCMVLYDSSSEPYTEFAENCFVNKKVSFGHGARLSPFCSIGPHVVIASDTEIGEGTYIGVGAIIQPKVKIGKNVTIASGSIVTKNIPDNAVVSGTTGSVRFFKKI